MSVCHSQSTGITLVGENKKRTLLRINLPNVSRFQLLLGQFCFLCDPLLVAFRQFHELSHPVDIVSTLLPEVVHLERLGPYVFMEVHKHVFLETCLAIVDRNAVIVSVETMNKRLDRWLIQVAQVRCCLPGLLAHDNGLGLDQTERINDDLALNRLYRINNHSNGTRRELLK